MIEEKQTESKKSIPFYLLFILNILILLIAGCSALMKTVPENGGSGFFIILAPIITGITIFPFIIPQIIGTILSIININKKSRLMTIFIFIILLISICSTILCFNSFKNF